MFKQEPIIPWGSFGVDKKKSEDHFGVGIISGAVQTSSFFRLFLVRLIFVFVSFSISFLFLF